MANIIIGKAEVIGIERVILNGTIPPPPPSKSKITKPPVPWEDVSFDDTGDISIPTAPATPPTSKYMVVSRLEIKPTGKAIGYTAIEGIMTIPAQLPFGKVYELMLHDTGTGVLDTTGREFKNSEEEL